MVLRGVILLSLAFVSSCGTLIKRDDYIRIDSKPRGQSVYVQNKKIGTTPLLAPRFDHSSQKVKVGSHSKTIDCSIDWKSSVIPNTVMNLLSGFNLFWYYGVDYFADNMRSCPETLKFGTKSQVVSLSPKKILVLPIRRFETVKKKEFLTVLQVSLNSISGEQASIVDYDESLGDFLSNGLGYERQWNFKDVDRNVINKALSEHQATHVVEVELIGNNKARAVMHDVFLEEETAEIEIEIPKELRHRNDIDRYARKVFYYIPNAVALTQSYGLFVSSNEEDYEDDDYFISSENHPDTLPGLLGNISVETVISPYYYDVYDYDFLFAPSASFSSFRSKVEKWNGLDDFEFERDVDSLVGFFTMDMIMAGISPMGNFSFSLGAGVGAYSNEDSLGEDSILARPVSKLGLNYTFFLSDRWYLRLDYKTYNTQTDPYSISGRVYDSVSFSSFGVGYFFPETRTWFQ